MGKIYWCEWLDSQSYHGWQDDSDYSLAICQSVGFIVKETKEFIALATSTNEEESNATITIPKKCILKSKILSL